MDFDQEIIDRIENDQSVFPNTEMYSIHWIGGSSGAFLRSLTQLYVLGCDHKPFIENLSSFNNSHDSVFQDGFNWHPESFKGITQGHIDWMLPRHRYVKPLYENLPVLVVDHIEPDYETLWQRWPKGKILVVCVRVEDQFEMHFNMYWKAFVQYYPDEGNVAHWASLKKLRPDIFEKYDHPADISNDDMILYVFGENTREAFDNFDVSQLKHKMQPFYSMEGNVPEDRKDMVLRVPYYNLSRQPELTMEILSNFIGKPTTDGIREFYYTYIERQNKLIMERAPWLRDPSKPWSIPV